MISIDHYGWQAMDLPSPDSADLIKLVPGTAARVVYRILWDHRERGITMQELRRLAAPALQLLGRANEQEQLDRRKRDLHEHFEIEKIVVDGETRHRLVRRKTRSREARIPISARERAIVLQPGRCAMCGRTPLEDWVKLVVDHRIPLEWGGTNKLDNLQPLCEECNAGKKAHFASYSEHSAAIRKAANYDEPQKRIGELLKAFEGNWVPDDLLELVANAKQHQADWHRRMRELRDLGWQYEYTKKREDRRVRTYYRLVEWKQWPSGPLRLYLNG